MPNHACRIAAEEEHIRVCLFRVNSQALGVTAYEDVPRLDISCRRMSFLLYLSIELDTLSQFITELDKNARNLEGFK